MVIVIDTREQKPLDFSAFKDVTVQRRETWPGDYTVLGGTAYFAIERKSVSDLIGTMKTGYAGYGATTPKRFDRELMALASIVSRGGIARIVVEPDGFVANAHDQIAAAAYWSIIQPKRVFAFIETIRKGWGVPVDLTENRAHSAKIVHDFAAAALEVKRARMAQDKAVKAASERANDGGHV